MLVLKTIFTDLFSTTSTSAIAWAQLSSNRLFSEIGDFYINNLESNFIDPLDAEVWKNPAIDRSLKEAMEFELNKKNAYGFKRFYSHAFNAYEDIDIDKMRDSILKDGSRCLFFVDHQIARRIRVLSDPVGDDDHSKMGRAMIGLCPFLNARLDFFNSALEQNYYDKSHKKYISETLLSLSRNPFEIAKGLLGIKSRPKTDKANFIRITQRDPMDVYADEYVVDLCHLIKLIQLYRNPTLNNVGKLKSYLEWQISYLVNPIALTLGIALFKDTSIHNVWKDLTFDQTDDDRRILSNQLWDLQYSHRYSRISSNCESTGIIPVMFSNDAGLLLLLTCVSCGTGEEDSRKKVLALIDFFYGKSTNPAVEAASRRFEKDAPKNIQLRQNKDWRIHKNKVEDEMFEWWKNHTGREFKTPGMRD